MSAPRLGAHVSIAGGTPRAVERGVELGAAALQIFVKSPSQWRAPMLAGDEAAAFRAARAASPIGPVVAHAAYLINLASPDRSLRARSRRALAAELERARRLGLDALVVHPGAHMGAGEERGLQRIAASIDAVLARAGPGAPRLLLENTAGQGTNLGHDLGQLAEILSRSKVAAGTVSDGGAPPRGAGAGRVGVCIDTAHAFAAGHPIQRAVGYDRFFAELERTIGLERLGCLHLNDSKTPLGSRVDRHENIGQGHLGAAPFRRLLRDPRLAHLPMILETPLGDDRDGHRRDLARLRRWLPQR